MMNNDNDQRHTQQADDDATPEPETEQGEKKESPSELAQEYLDGWKRERAAFANYKKDEVERLGQLQLLLKRQFLSKLLPILDSFELALKSIPQDLQASDWFKGYAYIKKQFNDMLKDEGIEVIETADKEFDPRLHEAIEASSDEEQEGGALTIQEELQTGYKIGDFVLRPARVKVGKQKSDNQ